MHDIQSPRRRRHQPEIDQLVREFRDSGLNQREFAQKIGVHPLTVNRWIRTTPVVAPTHRLAVQVALLIPRRHPDSSRSKSDKI